MENKTPYLAMQDSERQLKGLLRSVDMDMLTKDEKKAIAGVRRLAADARIDIRDYELSETRVEQLKKAVAARKRLGSLQASILAAGAAFGPADVAQLDAQLEYISDWLK